MLLKKIKNLEASIRIRLLNLSRESGENYNAVLLRFFQERFLARLGASPYGQHFVLKGGLLLLSRQTSVFRPTMDIDMLGIAVSNDPMRLTKIIEEITSVKLNDGVRFDTNSIIHRAINEDAEYQGLRFVFRARLGKMVSKMQLDIAFGDEVPFDFRQEIFPVMLSGFSAPEILHYPLESVISEKFQAIIYLGLATSRMKDFYDILFLCENNSFVLKRLKSAIVMTFEKRETDLTNRFFIYEQSYISQKENLWKLFLKKINSDRQVDFSEVLRIINRFIEPVITSGSSEENLVWNMTTRQWE